MKWLFESKFSWYQVLSVILAVTIFDQYLVQLAFVIVASMLGIYLENRYVESRR
jgi:hypothetical protein